jgi:hypothetical protein
MLTPPRSGSAITCLSRPPAKPARWEHRWFRSFRMTPASLLLTLLAVMTTATHASAQAPPPGLVEVGEGDRQGFWLGLGVGAGGESYDVTNGPGYSNLFYQPTVSLRAGGTIGSHLRLGGEVLSWIDDQGDRVRSLSSVLFLAQFYPIRAAGLYLKGGLGIGRDAVDFDDGFRVSDIGFAGLVGAGYELRLARHVYLNPVVDLIGHTYDSRSGGSHRERLVNFGIGVLFQS